MSKFDKMFERRSVTPLDQMPPALTPGMKAVQRHGADGWDDRPVPARRFAAPKAVEQIECAAPRMMAVEELTGPNFGRRGLWCASTEAVFRAVAHGDGAPPDAELPALGWRPALRTEANANGAT